MKNSGYQYADLVFNLPMNRRFSYEVPREWQGKISVGMRVVAPFANRELPGYVMDCHNRKPSFNCKEIKEISDEKPVFNQTVMDMAAWISEYYLCSIGEAMAICVPKETKEKLHPLPEVTREELHSLNEEQREAVDKISCSIKEKRYEAFLLFGVTGSGKTEVYKYLAQEVISVGRQALVLVPEIALTPQTIRRFQSYFGERIAVLHSKLSKTERSYHWMRILKGEVDIIMGARSAIFSPPERIGIIIIDEEHESSYKSGETPRYHARQVAFKLARTLKIPLVMGTATPSLENFYHSLKEKITLIPLMERHSQHKDQLVTVVDMRMEESKSFISRPLFEKIADRLQKGEQVMIFLNKRGHSPLLICQDCGHTLKCAHCDISLTYHHSKNRMLCHYCGYGSSVITICPECGGKEISLIGYGTEKVEEELSQIFMSARIGRMDLDSTRRKGAHEKILTSFKKKEVDILIGTQMIAKGLHFPNVTLVGVVLADLSLHLPDFRASERTFSLLTQISGRAGRGELAGEVIIQTYLPNHYVIQTAKEQNYRAFFQCEIEERRKYLYPPFSRFLKILVRGKNEEMVIRKVNEIYDHLKHEVTGGVEILGPAPAPLSKLNNNFRWQMILKGKEISPLQTLGRIAQTYFKKSGSVYLELDVDPVSMM